MKEKDEVVVHEKHHEQSAFSKKWLNFKSTSFGHLQNVARVIVFPIAVLPIAGLFLGIGGGFASAADTNHWGEGIVNTFTVVKTIGNIIFANLGLLFAISVAFGFAKASKGVAAVAGFIAFLTMEVTISALFIPNTTAGTLGFDPWKLGGDNGLIKTGEDNGMLKNVDGISPTLDLSVLGGILVGWLTSLVHNKTYNIKVPKVLAFFGGEKFVPIATFLMGIIMGSILFFVWPMILKGLYEVGSGLGAAMDSGTEANKHSAGKTVSGMAITFIFGFIERLLIPAGLHHVFYSPFWYSSAGGQWIGPDPKQIHDGIINGWSTTSGSYNIFFEQMNYMGKEYQISDSAYKTLLGMDGYSKIASQVWTDSAGIHHIAYNHFTMEVGTVFSSGRFAFMQYGYPFGAAAIIMLSKKENRSRTIGIIGSAAATSFLTGITEPILFSFLFVAPLLYVYDAILAGCSFAICYALNINVGQGFAAGFIDYSFFGLIPSFSNGVATHGPNTIANMWAGRCGALWIPLYGLLILSPAYFFGFWGIIIWKDYKTPGRGDEVDDVALEAVSASLASGTKHDITKEEKIINGLGGVDNISEYNDTKTSLIVKVKSAKKVNEGIIKTSGIKTITIDKNNVTLLTKDSTEIMELIDKAMYKKDNKEIGKSSSGYSHDYLEKILQGLGGHENITVLDNCATRLRVNVKDGNLVDEKILKEAKAIAVVKRGNSVQLIYGGEAQNIKVALETIWRRS
ncbi:PTS transporter subunit EIIC [Spiroplasma endosymbiont of Aspidapion aeneum]|uniref:PTS transporter subunit EIIC n=1 Tax=Spiroplasma endosymbiont of Aspidapion aeneum TaxID=3066276 RepID=UPI00313BC0F8